MLQLQRVLNKIFIVCMPEFIKGVLSEVRQFSATENPLKMMKNAFYFPLIALFVLKILKFLP